MADQSRPDDLARLRAEFAARLAAQDAAIARLTRRRRLPRRLAPLALVALLVALLPLSLLAAGSFIDLDPAQAGPGGHNPNIQAIADAGITRGCDPPTYVQYCPKDYVTREQMASFLARTAGLGGNPPVANAKTAVSAQTAANAVHAASADQATAAATAATARDASALGGQPPAFYQPAGQPIANATNAVNAQNASALGGYAPSALGRVAFSTARLASTLPGGASTDLARVTVAVPGPAPQAVLVRGAFNAFGQTSGGFLYTTIRQDGAANAAGSGQLNFPFLTNGIFTGIAAHAEWAFVAAPGSHTYTLVAFGNGTGELTVDRIHLVATTHPFGAAGTPGTAAIDPAPGGEQPAP